MGDVIDELLARNDVSPVGPASYASIDALSRRFDVLLPEPLLRLWRTSDGLAINSLEAHILGPTEVLKLITDDVWDMQYLERGLVPFLDDHESNYLAVAAREPLEFRILHVPHDGGSRLLYRDFESCIRALVDAANQGESADLFLFRTEGDYSPDAPRSIVDQVAGKTLLAGKHELDEWNHAAQLIDASNLAEWVTLLETDHFVRRDVRSRMQKMRSPAIRDLLNTDEQAFEAFATKFIEVVRGAGLQVGERSGECVRVGASWYNLEGFYHRRNIRDAMPRMLAWIEDQLAGRNPHDRIENYMCD